MEDQWRVAEYDSEWKSLFLTLGTKLREVLGEAADRIDHVGSTSIEGMDAKPIVDIQQMDGKRIEILKSYLDGGTIV